jgi:hypothetical protein
MYQRVVAPLGRLLPLLVAMGCYEEEPVSKVEPPPAQAPAESVVQPDAKPDALDLLFVVDNSGSMASEQLRLEAQMQRIVEVLTKGDRQPKAAFDPSDTTRYFPAIKSLHVGVISTNLGGIDEPPQNGGAISTCRGQGDDAILRRDTSGAASGTIARSNIEFEGYRFEEVVLPPDPSCALGTLSPYQEYVAGTHDPSQVANNVRCLIKAGGLRGCPFEQPLEAMWKALAPSSGTGPLFEFRDATRGHGDLANSGFLRPEALLAVIHISDEDDCSITTAGKALFDPTRNSPAEEMYGEKINLRCGLFGDDPGLLHPVSRYVEGLKALKPQHPERVIFGALVGTPTDVTADQPLATVLARPDMAYREEGQSGLLAPSCIVANPENPTRTDKANPGRRFLQVADGFGANGIVHSICATDYTPALDRIVDRIAALVQ